MAYNVEMVKFSLLTLKVDQKKWLNLYIYQARALGLLLADGTPTVGGGKTF